MDAAAKQALDLCISHIATSPIEWEEHCDASNDLHELEIVGCFDAEDGCTWHVVINDEGVTLENDSESFDYFAGEDQAELDRLYAIESVPLWDDAVEDLRIERLHEPEARRQQLATAPNRPPPRSASTGLPGCEQ